MYDLINGDEGKRGGENDGDILSGGAIGNSILIKAGQSSRVIKISGDDEKAMVCSIVLVPPQASDLAKLTTQCGLFARINFGIGGIQSTFEVDYVNGYSFSLPASSISVEAFNLNNNNQDLTFGAFVSHLPLANAKPPRRTIQYGNIGPGASVGLPIPQYASSVQIFRPDNGFGSASAFRIRMAGSLTSVGVNNDCPVIPIPGFLIYGPLGGLIIDNQDALQNQFIAVYELGV